jgi:rod shape-determining protein MreC
MPDKTTRRRRAVLILLVALSLILLTAYFGEAPNGRLHSVQREFLAIVSPIQDGANKALKPVRDLFGWFGNTLHAKSRLAAALKQNDRLRAQLVERQGDERSYQALRRLVHLDNQLGPAAYHAVTATVTGESPSLWSSTIDIDKGTAAGVQVKDPVIVGEGVIGKVTLAAPDGAQVSLITDSGVGVTAMINETGAPGLVVPKVGDPNDLVMQYLPTDTAVSPGEYVVTSGTISSPGESLYPRGIPIGQVTSVQEEGPNKVVNVQPLANLHNLEVVQVLTYKAGSAPDRASTFAASAPPGQTAGAGGASEAQLASTGTGG